MFTFLFFRMFLLPCSCLAWIIAVLATNSCKFVRVDEDTAFGMFRVQNPKTGFCESFPVDDPANALVAARVFAVITTVLLGVTFVMIGGLCSLPLFDEDFQKDYFPKQPVQYRLWMCVTVMQYLSIWTSIYQYFIFGLDFCKANDYEDNPLAPQCKLGPGGMSTLFNIAFLVLIWLVAVWYVWDALTPRPLTKEAKRQSNIAPDHDIAKQTSSRKRMSMATEDLTDSPRLQAHKNEVRKELMNKRRSPKGSKRKLGSVNSPNPSRQRASVPVMTRAPRPGAKRATSVPNMQKQPSARRPRDKRPLSMSPQPQRKPRVSATTDSHTEFTIGSKPRVVRVNSTKNNISQRNSRASPRPSSASPRRKPIEERKSNTAKTMPPMPNL